jgi:hypothetical protein
VSADRCLAVLHAELAANARARIPFLIAGAEEDAGYRALEARAAELRAAIQAAAPRPQWWEEDDPRRLHPFARR